MRSVKFKMAEKQILTMFGAEIAHSGLLLTLLISDLFYIKHHKHHNSSRLSLAVARTQQQEEGRKPDIPESRRTYPDDFLFIDLKRQ